ncbi:MAG: dienelactone hydrolase family protein [Chloroflexi bacterium]|nr:MAG: dienelactone hydrolase family protein [Chloroflexota bacterium]
MPIYHASHVEYHIATGHIQIVMDDGTQLPAYWAHPTLGKVFPGIALLHDWWGFDDLTRRLANYFAQMGYYVIAPDLFFGEQTTDPREAMRLVERYQKESYHRVDTALAVLEKHHQCNAKVAAIGLGMGGSLVFEAAIRRPDLEAAIAFGGFPQSYLDEIDKATTPILALYGSEEPYTKPPVLRALKKAFEKSPLPHKLEILPGLGHTFFSQDFTPEQRAQSAHALELTLDFMEQHLAENEDES